MSKSNPFYTKRVLSDPEILDNAEKLEKLLNSKGIDTASTRVNLPKGDTKNMELVYRLIGVARANGYIVNINTKGSGNFNMDVILASKAGMLQHSHGGQDA